MSEETRLTYKAAFLRRRQPTGDIYLSHVPEDRRVEIRCGDFLGHDSGRDAVGREAAERLRQVHADEAETAHFAHEAGIDPAFALARLIARRQTVRGKAPRGFSGGASRFR